MKSILLSTYFYNTMGSCYPQLPESAGVYFVCGPYLSVNCKCFKIGLPCVAVVRIFHQ